MADVAPALPTRFPCWCRAVYSFGGESKKDLGFVEGDLIECLNAGDGSWWMGRLRRDKRAMGLFPSNFVQVLEDSFIPVSRATSPMPSRAASPNPSPQKSKTVFRKPFQAYSAPMPARDSSPNKTANLQPAILQTPSRQNSHQSTTPHHAPAGARSGYGSRIPSPAPPVQQQQYSRASSPAPRVQHHQYSRSASPAPPVQQHHYSRVASPVPPVQHHQHFRAPSPIPYQNAEQSPPPPPPPPHRVAYNHSTSRAPSPAPPMNDRYPTVSRGPSPMPSTPGLHGLTPSPLRDAMDDVMTSLQGMSVQRNAPSPCPQQPSPPLNPWSPEAFDELRTKSRTRAFERPQSYLGIAAGYAGEVNSEYHDEDEEPPHLSTYVARMEHRLRAMQQQPQTNSEMFLPDNDMPPPAPPPKNSPYQPRPTTSMSKQAPDFEPQRKLRSRKSAYELGREVVGRTFTTKSTATNTSSATTSTTTNSTTSTQMTGQSIMSAGGFSATSAGSLARRKGWGSIRRRPTSAAGYRRDEMPGISPSRPETPLTGISYHSSHASRPASAIQPDWAGSITDASDPLGGLTQPRVKKTGFFMKLVESAKTGAASARGSIAAGQVDTSRSPIKGMLSSGVTSISGGGSSAARDMGLGGKDTIDWVQVRRDVNRSNSLSRNERIERADRCQMLSYPVIASVDVLEELAEGDEGLDGLPVSEPTNFAAVNLQLVDKAARFVSSLPPMTTPASLAQGYVCRPYRSDVQRLRAIFTWVSEKIAWEEDFEGEVSARRVIQTRRGCAEEVAVLTMEMCLSMGIHAEVVRGYLKSPGEMPSLGQHAPPNHWWNAVLADGEWRILDCSLASPSHPKRSLYSSAPSQAAESWYFLARPLEACYTHIPQCVEQQHIVPPLSPEILLSLPCACPPYFRNELRMYDYDTSLLRLENLDLAHITLVVPGDIELFAAVTSQSYARDSDGDLFESGDLITTPALAQALWVGGQKRYIVKAVLPSSSSEATLKIYAGKRGLMHSIRDNPHPLALALPLSHEGTNPPFEFLTRHPTPHAMRHDLYVAQPQCRTLAVNNTFVFAVRQHPSSFGCGSPNPNGSGAGRTSPLPFNGRPGSSMSMALSGRPGSAMALARPGSAMSMTSSVSGSGSNYLNGAPGERPKAAKLAIQAPSGKILRLSRKAEGAGGAGYSGGSGKGAEVGEGSVWETIIKIGERGTWRGLVLADRSARWCVWGEWECV